METKPNKRYRWLAIVLFLFATSYSAIAQSPIKGAVADETDQPIPYATVILCSDSVASSVLKGYAITDAKGYFTIQAEAKPCDWLIVRCLGYKELKRKILDFSDFVLLKTEEDAFSLDEITVNGKYAGIKFSNDTIIFDTEYFKTGTEDNLGDVLKKMPGMDVSETGKISYAGKDIHKILINGRDLFSSNDNMIINNMSADMMSGAELLTDYKDNSLADAYKSKETLALNIKTSDKKKWSGNIDAGGGYKNKYQGKSTLLFLNKKFSLTSILSANNVGTPVFSMEDYITNIIGLDNLLS